MAETVQTSGAKQKLWRVGLYLTPFAFALVLMKWGNLFPGWLVIVFAAFVVALFIVSGLIHLRDVGFKANFHDHPIPYVAAIVICCCLTLGTAMYLVMRPAPTAKAQTAPAPRVSSPGRPPPASAAQPLPARQQVPRPAMTTAPPTPNKTSPAVAPSPSSVTQDGNGNQQTVTQAPVTQSNIGGCNQQVIGGNNNTNNCAPQPRTLTSSEAKALAAAIAQISNGLQVKIGSADSGESQNYANQIRVAFSIKREVGTLYGWHYKGIYVGVNSRNDSAAIPAQKLAFQMRQAGMNIVSVEEDPQHDHPGEIEVIVGDQ